MSNTKAHYLPVSVKDLGVVKGQSSLKMKMNQFKSELEPTAESLDESGDTQAMQTPTDKQKFGYEETLIYGKYRKELGSFAKFQAKRRQSQITAEFGKVHPPKRRRWDILGLLYRARDWVLQKIGEDWMFLTMLGIIMGILSFVMDFLVEKIHAAKFMLYEKVSFSVPLQYTCWVMFSLLLIWFSTGFTHLVSPQAIGSGIPEMKTILRGVVLKEFLTFRTLVAKVVGLVSSLGSTLMVGKEGPFVHISSGVATLLTKLSSFKGIYENESRRTEMLAVACAVGVAGTYAAPIGGVLFSIEVTATFFAVRNYWRGFFTAVVVSVVFRLLGIWSNYEETITTMFKTSLKSEYPFYPMELIAFSILGVMCGLTASLFILLHRRIVLFTRQHKKMSAFLQKNRFIYPSIATILIASCTFPPGIGQYFAGALTHKKAIHELFSNITWTRGQANNLDQAEILGHWKHPQTNIYVSLGLFVFMQFWMSALTNTLPMPCGVFVPVFTIGAGIGRFVGETMAAWYPNGVKETFGVHRIVPGGYAVVGAAAFSGGVTRTISTSVMVFEVTGQISHVIPAVIAVLISNAVANLLQPSFYDSIIRLKRLPFLPSIVSSKVDSWNVYVEDIMVREVKYISFVSSYQDLKDLLETTHFRTYPLVDSTESMILLGSVKRFELKRLLLECLNPEPKVSVPDSVTSGQHSSASSSPRIKPKSKARFMVLQVDETSSKSQESGQQTDDTQPSSPGFRMSRSASAGKLEDLVRRALDTVRAPKKSILKQHNGTELRKSSSQSEIQVSAPVKRLSELNDSQADSIAEDVPFILNKFHIKELEKKVKLPRQPVKLKHLSSERRDTWEHEHLSGRINWVGCQIDPAPFQLVQRTSLHKVHSLFSLLGLNHTYVTNTGRLVGVVAIKELRYAIQGRLDEQAEKKKKKQGPQPPPPSDPESSEEDEVFEDPQQLEVVKSEIPDEYTLVNNENGKYTSVRNVNGESESEQLLETSIV